MLNLYAQTKRTLSYLHFTYDMLLIRDKDISSNVRIMLRKQIDEAEREYVEKIIYANLDNIYHFLFFTHGQKYQESLKYPGKMFPSHTDMENKFFALNILKRSGITERPVSCDCNCGACRFARRQDDVFFCGLLWPDPTVQMDDNLVGFLKLSWDERLNLIISDLESDSPIESWKIGYLMDYYSIDSRPGLAPHVKRIREANSSWQEFKEHIREKFTDSPITETILNIPFPRSIPPAFQDEFKGFLRDNQTSIPNLEGLCECCSLPRPKGSGASQDENDSEYPELVAVFEGVASWEELHRTLEDIGYRYERKGGGAVLRTIDGTMEIKASTVWRYASLRYCEIRYGPFCLPGVAPAVSTSQDWLVHEHEARSVSAVRRKLLDSLHAGETVEALTEKYGAAYESLARRYMKKIQKKKRILPRAPIFEIWFRNQPKEAEPLQFSCPDLYLPLSLEGKRQEIEKLHHALKVDRYRVTCREVNLDGEERYLVLNERDGFEDGYPGGMIFDKLARLGDFEKKQNEHIYFTPFSDDFHYIPLDDSDRATVERLGHLNPCCVIETSPDNFQVDFRVRKSIIPMDADPKFVTRALNDACAGVNIMFGDPGFAGSVHAQRMPGFMNPKPGYLRDGQSPVARVVFSDPMAVSDVLERYILWHLENRPSCIPKNYESPMEEVSDDDAFKLYRAQREATLDTFHKKRPASEIDESDIDYEIAKRLRATGHSQEDVAYIIEKGAALTGRRHNWPAYAEKTASSAWEERADTEIEGRKAFIPEWKAIEARALSGKKSAN